MDSYSHRERLDTKGFWVLFAITQISGLIAMQFGNVHTNPLPLFLALGLLLPGSLIDDPRLPAWATILLAIPINAAVWYLTRRLLAFAANKMGIQR
jgi:hypothetical protein